MMAATCVIFIGILHLIGLGTRRVTASVMAVRLLVLARVLLVLPAAGRAAGASGMLALTGDGSVRMLGTPHGWRGR